MVFLSSLRMSAAKNSVLFVCYGNICRSPMGEAILSSELRKRNMLQNWVVASCGTGDHEAGNSIYPKAQRALERKGLTTFQHTARKITKTDFETFQLILGFDNKNMRELQRMKPKSCEADIRLLNSFNSKRPNKEVDDPWFADDDKADKVFDSVYEDCLNSVEGIIKYFEEKQ